MNSAYGDPARLVQVISMLQLDKNTLAEERKAVQELLGVAVAKVAALETAANTNLRAVRSSEQSRGKLTAAAAEIETLQKENSVRSGDIFSVATFLFRLPRSLSLYFPIPATPYPTVRTAPKIPCRAFRCAESSINPVTCR